MQPGPKLHLNADLAAPSQRVYGIDRVRREAALDTMATLALTSGSPARNPRQPSHEDIKAIYHQVWAG